MLTRTSSRPKAAAVASTSARQSSGFVRLALVMSVRRPAATTSAAAASASARERLYERPTSMPASASAFATAAPMRLPPVMSTARPFSVTGLRNYLANQHDAELQLADFDDQRLVTEVGGVDGERSILRRRRIDAQHCRVLAAERLSRELDHAVMRDRGRILVDRCGRDEQETAERRDAEMVVVCGLDAVAKRVDAALHHVAADVFHVRVQF